MKTLHFFNANKDAWGEVLQNLKRASRRRAARMALVHAIDFKKVRAAAAALPDVEETTSWGAPALKVRGKMFVCQAINKQAEPNTLAVRMDIAQRDALIEEDPAVYYLKDHYVDYPCVLVRLSRVHPDALRDLVQTAYRFVSAKSPRPGPRRRPAVQRRPRASRKSRR